MGSTGRGPYGEGGAETWWVGVHGPGKALPVLVEALRSPVLGCGAAPVRARGPGGGAGRGGEERASHVGQYDWTLG